MNVVSHHRAYRKQTDAQVKTVGIVQTFWNCAEEDLPEEAIVLLPDRQRIEQEA